MGDCGNLMKSNRVVYLVLAAYLALLDTICDIGWLMGCCSQFQTLRLVLSVHMASRIGLEVRWLLRCLAVKATGESVADGLLIVM